MLCATLFTTLITDPCSIIKVNKQCSIVLCHAFRRHHYPPVLQNKTKSIAAWLHARLFAAVITNLCCKTKANKQCSMALCHAFRRRHDQSVLQNQSKAKYKAA
jgi:hypothetical protein